MFKNLFRLTTIVCDYNFINDFIKELLIWHFVKAYSFVRFDLSVTWHELPLVQTYESTSFNIEKCKIYYKYLYPHKLQMSRIQYISHSICIIENRPN